MPGREARLFLLALSILSMSAAAGLAADGDIHGAPRSVVIEAGYVWVLGFLAVTTALGSILKIWEYVRPKPAYRDQFAAKEHEHNQYLLKAEHTQLCEQRGANMRDAIKHATVDAQAVQRQLDHLSTTIAASFREQERRNEERASDIHHRINGISAPLSEWIGKVGNHIEEHNRRTPK
jgi:hypothetical protein